MLEVKDEFREGLEHPGVSAAARTAGENARSGLWRPPLDPPKGFGTRMRAPGMGRPDRQGVRPAKEVTRWIRAVGFERDPRAGGTYRGPRKRQA